MIDGELFTDTNDPQIEELKEIILWLSGRIDALEAELFEAEPAGEEVLIGISGAEFDDPDSVGLSWADLNDDMGWLKD